MANRPEAAKVLGPLEADAMNVLWAGQAPMSVRDVMQRLNEGRLEPLAYTTVMTVLTRLADKGVLARVRDGRGYVYEPAVSDVAQIAVRGVVRDFGDAALAHFVDEARADPDMLRRLRRLLDDEH
jgi:predicted transcriptional regulator